MKPATCREAKSFKPTSGLTKLYIEEEAHTAYCEHTDTTSWHTVLRRDGDWELFPTRLWKDYERGFGNQLRSFWFGLEKLHLMTKNQHMALRVELEDFDGNTRYAEYTYFALSSEDDGYRLFIDGYSGDAGDSLGYHNGAPFSTIDRDNDAYTGICAKDYNGAWWYKKCVVCCLTGADLKGIHKLPHQGIYWRGWRGANYSYKRAEMKIRPVCT